MLSKTHNSEEENKMTEHVITESHTNVQLEMAGHYVRTARCDSDMSGRIIAEFTFHNTKWEADAQLFIAAQDLLRVAYLVIETATIETPEELLNSAFQAVKKATHQKHFDNLTK